MRRPVAFHPLLVAAFPVLALWGQNLDEVPFGEIVGPLAVTVGAAAATFAITVLVLREHRRAAALTTLLALLALTYGHVWAVANPVFAHHRLLLTAWGVVGAALVVAVLRVRRLVEVTKVLNALGLVLVVTALVPVASRTAGDIGRRSPISGVAEAADLGDGRGPPRDIYYIVLDRYARADSMEELFDYDNRPFTGSLEALGFEVADGSVSNYPKTAHSLAASLNMTYLDELADEAGAGSSDWGPVYDLLRDHEVGRLLTDEGYEYVHLGTWWGPTSTSVHADRTLRYGSSSEFSQVFEQGTIVPGIRAVLGLGDESTRDVKRNSTEFQFRELEELAEDRSHRRPRFVFAHLTIPHEPYVFEADCSLRTEAEELAATRAENYVGQVRCANDRMRRILTELLAGPDEADPIVVLQADEGPHPVRYERLEVDFVWPEATAAELHEKFRILNAYHLPGVEADAVIDEAITPVNTFRLIFDAYFGTDLGRLPDRASVFESGHDLYTFTDVTRRVRTGR